MPVKVMKGCESTVFRADKDHSDNFKFKASEIELDVSKKLFKNY